MTFKGCGLLETPYNFFIDHLAPLCALLEIPIVSSHVKTKLLYHQFYPETEIILKKWNLAYLVQNYSTILYSFVPQPPFKTLIHKERKQDPDNPLWKNKTRFIYHLHGCSDKGYHSTWIDPKGHINEVDLLLIYGQRMEDLLKNKKLYHKPKAVHSIGNYRYLYYLKHQAFFDQKAYDDIFSRFKKERPVLLYAPTWEDEEGSCSFFKVAIPICKALSQDFNLLVKLHPNMTLKRPGYDPTPTLKLLYQLAQIPGVLVLPFYPLVYPLIQLSDYYLGDFSSVGYDVLAFNKPMFFFNHLDRSPQDLGAYLLRCGTTLTPKDLPHIKKIFHRAIERGMDSFIPIQKKTYHYAFGEQSTYNKLKDRLNKLI